MRRFQAQYGHRTSSMRPHQPSLPPFRGYIIGRFRRLMRGIEGGMIGQERLKFLCLNNRDADKMIGTRTGFILAVALAVFTLPAQAQSIQLVRLFQQFQLAQSSGDTDRAVVLAERMLELGDRELAPNSPDTLNLVETLARLRMTRNELSQARLLYQRALQIRQGRYGEGHPELVPVLYVLADLAIAEQIGRAHV